MALRSPFSRSRPGTLLLAVLAGAVALQALVGFNSAFTLPPGVRSASAAALIAATLLSSSPLPAVAEEAVSMKELEAKLAFRDEGIQRLQKEKLSPKLKQAEVEKLEREELAAARGAEKLREKQVNLDEKKAKQLAEETEKREKAAIEKEEKETKQKIDKDLKSKVAQIEATEKAEIDTARKLEREEKKAAKDVERKERAAAKDEAVRLAAEDKSEAAITAASEKAEAAIIAAKSKSEVAYRNALTEAEEARTAAAEKAELLIKQATEKAERAFTAATETAETAEKAIVEEEEQVEQKVFQAVEEIEKEEILEENQYLETAKNALSTVWSIIGPIILPGVGLALYAVIASFFAPKSELSRGGESEEVRIKMGRPARPKTAVARDDPWAPTVA
jgi:hypothetical protein